MTNTPAAATHQPGDNELDKEVRTRQHWHVVFLPILYSAALLALGLWMWINLSNALLGRFLFAYVMMVLSAPWYVYALKPFSRWFGTIYTINSEQVSVRTGLFRGGVDPALITDIANPKYTQSVIDKIFKSGRLKVTEQMTLEHVPKVEEAQKHLLRLVHRVVARVVVQPGTQPAQQPRNSAAQVPQNPPAPPLAAPPAPSAQGQPAAATLLGHQQLANASASSPDELQIPEPAGHASQAPATGQPGFESRGEPDDRIPGHDEPGTGGPRKTH